MKTNALIIFSLLGAATASAQGFKADFANGKFPAGITVEDCDGFEVPSLCYKNGRTSDGWTVATVGTGTYAAVSPSHSHDEGGQNNRMNIEEVTVEEGAVISWTARSVFSDFPDTYRIEALVEGSEKPVTVFKGRAEEVFTPHAVTLEKYTGKKVRFSFVCTSENGYLLAIKDIFIGVPEKPVLSLVDKTRRFAGNGETVEVTGTVFNSGLETTVEKVVLKVSSKEVASKTINETVKSAESFDFSIDLPVELNKKTKYTVEIIGSDGSVLASASSAAIASHFERNHFVDEGTGVWCNNCPEGMLALQQLKRDYPDQIVIATDHANDDLTNSDYWSGLKFFAVPYFMLNRRDDTKYSQTTNFENGLWRPTPVKIDLAKDEENVNVTVTTSEDIDNSNDRYRIGYVITGDFYQTEDDAAYMQKNSCNMPRHEAYYFLPNILPAHLSKYHNVNLDGEGYFDGIPNSIPADIAPGEATESFVIPCDGLEANEVWSNLRINAYVLDTTNGEILNSASIRLDEPAPEPEIPDLPDGPDGPDGPDSVNEVSASSTPLLRISGRDLLLSGSDETFVEIFYADGQRVAAGNFHERTVVPESVSGPVIIRATSRNATSVIKAAF
ncbi:MAG: hypothetical protein HDS31_00710 [Bacteroides sp.]|nr:hypothetical protein [Bacteroides sp.]